MVKANRFWIAAKWLLLVNLVCLAVPILPFLLEIFIKFTLRINVDLGLPDDMAMIIVVVPMFSIPLSVAVAIYKVVVPSSARSSTVDGDRATESSTVPTVASGFRMFALSMLISYGVISVFVLLAFAFASDSSLVGVWFIAGMPVALLVAVVAACIHMKNRRAVLLFLMVTVLPFFLYKWSYSRWQTEYFHSAIGMQRGEPAEAEWRDFLARYENSLFGSMGTLNQLDMVLSIGSIPLDILMKYVDHPDIRIQWSVATNPSLPEEVMYRFLEGEGHLRRHLAQNPALPQDIIDQLLGDEDPRVRDVMSKAMID